MLNNPLNGIDPSGFWSLGISAHFGIGFDLSYDFSKGHFQGGAGVGYGGGTTIGNNSWSIGCSNDNFFDFGYDNKLKSGYIRAQSSGSTQSQSGTPYGLSLSGTYYFQHSEYQVGVGVADGYGGINAGYSSFDASWSLGVNYAGLGASYDYGSHSWHYSDDPMANLNYYVGTFGHPPITTPGKNLLNGYYNPSDNGGIPPVDENGLQKNVFGLNRFVGGSNYFLVNLLLDPLTQGQPFSNLANSAGFNPVAVLHDYWMNNTPLNFIFNFPTMIPAAIITGGALLSDYLVGH